MTIKEFYDLTGSDYQDVLGRLMNDSLIHKFVLKFRNDQSFASLKDAVEKDDIELAFTSAHTLKGVAANMGFKKLYQNTSDLVEQLRPKNSPIDKELYKKVEEAYDLVTSNIDAID